VETSQVVLDLTGIFVFALSGALLGVRVRFDIVGIMVLAVITGIGGGIIRDVLIGDVPPASFRDWRYFLVPAVAALIVFRFHPGLRRIERFINTFDAAGLGLFCATGASKALFFGLDPVPSVLMGVVSGVGGGVLRDVLAGRSPVVLREDLYVVPAVVGATLVVIAYQAGWFPAWIPLAAAGVCFGLRVLAIRFHWRAPRASDLRD
jgi:uncharacterized membrane protein YeiH